MNLLHVNAHSALYLEMRDIFAQLGHRGHSWCVSRHMWRVGHDVPIIAEQAVGGWPDMDEAFCDRFARTYGPHLRSFDAFVVDHPVAMAALFEHTGRPVIAVSATRYDLGFAGDPRRWAWLDAALHRMYDRGQLLPLANNRGDRAYAGERLGFDWPLVPSLCAYTKTRFTGARRGWLRADATRSPLPSPYAWQDLAEYQGVVHVPYNCSQMGITEQYVSAIPLVVPSPDRLLRMASADQAGAMSQVSSLRVAGVPAGGGLNDYRNPDALRRWIDLSDWFDDEWMPHVIQAENPFDPAFLESLDATAWSAGVAATLPARRARILQAWTRVLDEAERRSGQAA